MSLELHDVPIFRWVSDASRTLYLYSAHTCLKLGRPALEMYLLWCRTSICCWNVAVDGSLMLDNPFSGSFFVFCSISVSISSRTACKSPPKRKMKNVCFFKQSQKFKRIGKGVPFIVTYYPLLDTLSSIIHKNLYLLYMNQEVKNVFTPGLIVSFRSASKISSYLVNSEKCGKSRCNVCFNIEKNDTFTSTTTSEVFKINHKLNCDDNCLIYVSAM